MGRKRIITLAVDFDDMCDGVVDMLPHLSTVKSRYPLFNCTLFTIPLRTSQATIDIVSRLNDEHGDKWIALAPHGWRHTRGECLAWTKNEAIDKIQRAAKMGIDEPVFKAPAWLCDGDIRDACTELGYGLYDHPLSKLRGVVHGHLTPVSGNWIGDMIADGRLQFATSATFTWVRDFVKQHGGQCAS